MDDERLAAIRERLSATSSGPWYATVNDLIGGYDVTTVDLPASERNPAVDGHVEIAWGITRQHAEFIVNAPADLAWLLAEVERLEAERDAATARGERLGAFGLRLAERNTLTELVGHGSNQLWMCRVCDQVGEKASVPHAPDCPFAALAEQGEG